MSRKTPLHLYLVCFQFADPGQAVPSGVENALLNLPGGYLGNECYRITETDYLIVDRSRYFEHLEALAVDTRATQIQQALLDNLGSNSVADFVLGEVVEKHDSCVLYVYSRAFRKLAEKNSKTECKGVDRNSDFQVLTFDQDKSSKQPSTDSLPSYFPIVSIEKSQEVVSFEMLASPGHYLMKSSQDSGSAGNEISQNIDADITPSAVRGVVMALALLRKAKLANVRINVRVSYQQIQDGSLTSLLDDIHRTNGKIVSGLDLDIYNLPADLRFDDTIKSRFKQLRINGHRLFIADAEGLFDMASVTKAVTVDGMKADRTIAGNLHNPLIRYVLDWYVKQAEFGNLYLHCAGIDSEESLNAVQKLGINIVSGRYFGPPEKINTISKKIKEEVGVER